MEIRRRDGDLWGGLLYALAATMVWETYLNWTCSNLEPDRCRTNRSHERYIGLEFPAQHSQVFMFDFFFRLLFYSCSVLNACTADLARISKRGIRDYLNPKFTCCELKQYNSGIGGFFYFPTPRYGVLP